MLPTDPSSLDELPASPLQLAVRTLRQQAEQALRGRITAARPQLDQLQPLLDSQGPDVKAVWSVLDELEDQLEALLRD